MAVVAVVIVTAAATGWGLDDIVINFDPESLETAELKCVKYKLL